MKKSRPLSNDWLNEELAKSANRIENIDEFNEELKEMLSQVRKGVVNND